MSAIRLGIIGLGGRALSLAGILRGAGKHLFQITAICDVFPNKAQEVQKVFGLPASAAFTDGAELLKADVEAVLIETGAQALAPMSLVALNAGKHVLCDVPMAFTRQECLELVAAVKKTGRVYCMAEQVRYANFVYQWKKHIQAGDIGEPLFIQGEYIHPVPGWYYEDQASGKCDRGSARTPVELADDSKYRKTWRNTFKHVIKYIPHELSPLLKIIDDRVKEVSCFASDHRMYGAAVEMLDLECALMKTAKGRVMRIVNSFTAPRGGEYFHHWYQILGSDGVLETARSGWQEGSPFGPDATELLRAKDGRIVKTHYGWNRKDMPFGDPNSGHSGLEAFVFQEFHDAIRFKKPLEGDIYRTVEAVLPGIVAAESAEAGGVKLEVPDVR